MSEEALRPDIEPIDQEAAAPDDGVYITDLSGRLIRVGTLGGFVSEEEMIQANLIAGTLTAAIRSWATQKPLQTK